MTHSSVAVSYGGLRQFEGQGGRLQEFSGLEDRIEMAIPEDSADF